MASRTKFGYEVVLQYGFGALLLCASSLGEKNSSSINIGAIMALDTTSGKIARTAMELAVEDVNRNSSILNGTLLNIDIRDSRQDALTGASAGKVTSSTQQI